MICSDALARNIFAQKNIKATRQRISVLGALMQSEVPLTAEELFMGLHEADESLSLSTVYRILDAFCKHGIAVKSGLMEGGKALYEMIAGVHRHNLICVKCHRITPLEDCPLSEYESNVEKSTGYEISGHKLELFGICPKCR